MDYIKYLSDNKYLRGEHDCWTLIQDIIKEEQNIELPDCPIMTDLTEFETKLKSNFNYRILEKPQKGCLVHYIKDNINHVGYAVTDKKYIHKTFKAVVVSEIPASAVCYEVLSD